MTDEEIVRYVMSFLGGGFAVAVGNWVYSTLSSSRQREVEHLMAQLQTLYGPLYYFTQQNEKLFELCGQFDTAYTKEFVSKEWSQDLQTQAAVKKDADATIELSNQYVRRVVANNERVMETLEKGWHLVDCDDVDELATFQVDFTRFKTEVNGPLKAPYMVYKALGDISYMRPAMIERVKQKVHAKEARLRELRRPWWKCAG